MLKLCRTTTNLLMREVGPRKNAYIPKGHRLLFLKNNIRSQPPLQRGDFLKKIFFFALSINLKPSPHFFKYFTGGHIKIYNEIV